MKPAFVLFFVLAFAVPSLPLLAENTTKTTTVENGIPTTHIHRSDDPAVGDPVGGRPSASDDKGPANTQKHCESGSTDPACVRAEKRQTAPTTWQEDCASGATKACPK